MSKLLEKKIKLQKLTTKLNIAAKDYYSGHESNMSDHEYDTLYAELESLEKELGMQLATSPTKRVGYEVVSSLAKVEHEIPALSLDKTKDRASLRTWLNGREGILSWKLDGLTLVLTYDNGKLIKAVTRGNGHIGEDVTHNSKYVKGIPQTISYEHHLTVRGECVICYEDFEKINEKITDINAKYKNPRNLASGSIRALDSKTAASRRMNFIAFSAEEDPEYRVAEDVKGLFTYLASDACKFTPVEHFLVTPENVVETLEKLEERITGVPFPTDGLVLTYNDMKYGKSLGTTGKFPKHSIAFKWADETAETVLREIEWSASRTGLLNPVAIFDPVELEGTTVSRASVHNIAIIRQLKLGIGDTISVYKSNMIIPQLMENLTKSDNYDIPEECPVCHGKTERKWNEDHTSEFLYCKNPECVAKHVGKFEHLVCRDGLNIVGLSESTLEKLVSAGYLKSLPDIFHISQYAGHIMHWDGFGEKSCKKLLDAIEKARNTTFAGFFYSLSIPGCGHDAAKILKQEFSRYEGKTYTDCFEEYALHEARLAALSGIGPVSANAIHEWMQKNQGIYNALKEEIVITDNTIKGSIHTETSKAAGKTFVITGSLNQFNNREELKQLIEDKGGKVAGSVSKNTTALINNDVTSTSGKNKKANELGIPIISEEEFLKSYIFAAIDQIAAIDQAISEAESEMKTSDYVIDLRLAKSFLDNKYYECEK